MYAHDSILEESKSVNLFGPSQTKIWVGVRYILDKGNYTYPTDNSSVSMTLLDDITDPVQIRGTQYLIWLPNESKRKTISGKVVYYTINYITLSCSKLLRYFRWVFFIQF